MFTFFIFFGGGGVMMGSYDYSFLYFFEYGSMLSVTQMFAPTTDPCPMVILPSMVALE